jgi:antitoxin (DNA-binding transcriptional repressor) of toxin-antitoxin stability system
VQTVTLDEAQRRLPDLVRGLQRDGEVLITHGNHPVARLTLAPGGSSLRDLKPTSVQAFLKPFPNADDDLLGEMLDRH